MRRTVTIKIQPSKEQEKALFELADIGAKVWNRVNYLRRQEFFEGKPVFNAGLVGAFNILKKAVKTTTPTLSALSGGNWLKTKPKTRFSAGLPKPPHHWQGVKPNPHHPQQEKSQIRGIRGLSCILERVQQP